MLYNLLSTCFQSIFYVGAGKSFFHAELKGKKTMWKVEMSGMIF